MPTGRPFERVAVDKDLLKVKDLVCRREKVFIDQEHESVSVHVGEIGRRVSDLENAMRVKKSKSATVFRRKKQLAYIIKQRGCVSADEASKALGISRNRANEYLKDMERSGLLMTKKKGRVVSFTAGGRS